MLLMVRTIPFSFRIIAMARSFRHSFEGQHEQTFQSGLFPDAESVQQLCISTVQHFHLVSF